MFINVKMSLNKFASLFSVDVIVLLCFYNRKGLNIGYEVLPRNKRGQLDSPTYHWSHMSLVPRVIGS